MIPYLLLFLASIMTIFQNVSGEKPTLDITAIPIITKQPEEQKIYPIVIIGAGAAGTMAVLRSILNNTETLLFTGAKQERRRSRGNWVRKVDNIPGFAKYTRAVLELRNETLNELMQSPLHSNLYVIEDSVYSIEKKEGFFRLTDSSGRFYHAKYVVMATGIMDEQPNIQGSIRPILTYANGQTVLYCSICDGHRSIGKKTVVIGYAKSAADTALLLSKKYPLASLTILTNGHTPTFTSEQLKQIQNQKIRVLEAPIEEVLGHKELKQLTGFRLETGEIVEAEIGFVSLGIRPNNSLAIQLGANIDASGLVVTDSNGESSVPNLFVIGDLRANSMKQIYTAWQHAVESMQYINKRMRE